MKQKKIKKKVVEVATETLRNEILPSDNETEEVVAIKKDLGKAISLDTLSRSPGGKELIKAFTDDIADLVENLASNYKKLSLVELLSICADLNSKLAVIRAITRAKTNSDFLQNELREALKE